MTTFHIYRTQLRHNRIALGICALALLAATFLPLASRIEWHEGLFSFAGFAAALVLFSIFFVYPHESTAAFWQTRPISRRQMLTAQCGIAFTIFAAFALSLVVFLWRLDALILGLPALAMALGGVLIMALLLIAIFIFAPTFPLAVMIGGIGFVVAIVPTMVIAFARHYHSGRSIPRPPSEWLMLLTFLVCAAAIFGIACYRRDRVVKRLLWCYGIVFSAVIVCMLGLPERTYRHVEEPSIEAGAAISRTIATVSGNASLLNQHTVRFEDPQLVPSEMQVMDGEPDGAMRTSWYRNQTRVPKQMIIDAVIRDLGEGTQLFTRLDTIGGKDHKRDPGPAGSFFIHLSRLLPIGSHTMEETGHFRDSGCRTYGKVIRRDDGRTFYRYGYELLSTQLADYSRNGRNGIEHLVVMHCAKTKTAAIIVHNEGSYYRSASLFSRGLREVCELPDPKLFGGSAADITMRHYLLVPEGYTTAKVEE